jgi:hypothetical protein
MTSGVDRSSERYLVVRLDTVRLGFPISNVVSAHLGEALKVESDPDGETGSKVSLSDSTKVASYPFFSLGGALLGPSQASWNAVVIVEDTLGKPIAYGVHACENVGAIQYKQPLAKALFPLGDEALVAFGYLQTDKLGAATGTDTKSMVVFEPDLAALRNLARKKGGRT